MKKSATANFFYRLMCGAFIGISIIAPGVSGSIMAVMMGIYDDLLEIISNPFKNFKRNVIYIMPMGIGALISIFALIKALDFLFDKYPTPAYLLFISLIVGSIPTVFDEIKKPFKKHYLIGLIGAFIFAFFIGKLAVGGSFSSSVIDTSAIWYLSICGAIAGVTSMVPGMSVSMMLMMLGAYEPLLKAASALDILTAAPVTICFGIGMILFSNLTKRIFTKYRNFAYFMVIGFMVGSVVNILPELPKSPTDWLFSVLAIGAGIGISVLFKFLGKKFNTGEELSLDK